VCELEKVDILFVKKKPMLTFIWPDTIVTQKSENASKPIPTLLMLPTELQCKVFSYLNPCFSTCLGITCKKFYSIHRSIHGRVDPTELDFRGKGRPNEDWYKGIMLWEYLVEWTAPKIWMNRERRGARYVACNVDLDEGVWRMGQALTMRKTLLQQRIDKIGRIWID
jgi:hypothetical protein